MTATAAGRSAEPSRPRLPWFLLGLSVVLVGAMVILSLGEELVADTLSFGAIALAFAASGALVATRHPRNPLGWIFCALGVSNGFAELWESFAYHDLPTADAGTWYIGWSWILDGCSYALIFLLFPDGRLLTRRWRWVLWLLAAACFLAIPGQATSPDNPDNPLVVHNAVLRAGFVIGIVLLLVAIFAALVSLAVRYRRSMGIERLQLRLFVGAGAAFVVVMTLAVPFWYRSVLIQAVTSFATVLLPAAAAVAILRYRLYDIDVVINRTLVYGSLTATLAGAYVGSVLVLQLALNGLTDGSGLAVAASTLGVAALFRPARNRIQRTVDRRFFRSRYDAARTLRSFGSRLRDEVDLDILCADLEGVVMETMSPAHVTLWLRASAVQR